MALVSLQSLNQPINQSSVTMRSCIHAIMQSCDHAINPSPGLQVSTSPSRRWELPFSPASFPQVDLILPGPILPSPSPPVSESPRLPLNYSQLNRKDNNCIFVVLFEIFPRPLRRTYQRLSAFVHRTPLEGVCVSRFKAEDFF